jgi:uncharacterized protein (DUF362 family)
MGLIIASGDRIANDLVGLGIVKHFGLWPSVSRQGLWQQEQIERAGELGLGASRPEDIRLSFSPQSDKRLAQLVEKIRPYIAQKE